MALPSPLKFSEPGSSTGGRLFSSQAGAPRLRPSRASMLTRAISPVTRAISPVTFNDSRTRLAGHGTSSFSDEFYHAPRRNSRWALLSAPVVVYKVTVSRFGRRQGSALLCLCCLALFLTSYVFHRRYLSSDKAWPSPFRRPNTVVFEKEELRKIWEWEVWSGHYPSTRPVPAEIGLVYAPTNPAIPPNSHNVSAPAKDGVVQHTFGSGPKRIYPDIRNKPQVYGHPPRPIPGSAADLDRIYQQCNYDDGKYVRDCHEYLRLGAGLDDSVRLRREDVEHLRYVFVPEEGTHSTTPPLVNPPVKLRTTDNWERDLTVPAHPHTHHKRDGSPCNEDDARIFHMFWAGPFTDKPYMALLAFLFTQNLGLDLPEPDPTYCRPQLWLWISRRPGEPMPSMTAHDEMLADLRANAWASPFLHPRFKDIIQFRLWNTTEQLDGVPELKNEWRNLGKDFLRSENKKPRVEDATKTVGSPVSLDGNSGETHTSYNKVPVILSDLVRFVLCHRFGGVYLDVDMLFLRDWEELWGWSGSFSYRWSHEDRYNTAVLRLRRGSALGSFLIRTALAHGLDFHPTSVTRYLKDAHMSELLYRVPDALFDPSWQACDLVKHWWGIEYIRRERPPQPFFTDFDQFFNTPDVMSASPSVVGFNGFFRGAYLYHYHNEWWKPFDRARYWPDLGSRFEDAERMGRSAVANLNATYPSGLVAQDKRDLDWSTVLKRTFEAYIRGERPNMYGEWIRW